MITLNDLQNEIDNEMKWRKKELVAIRENIKASKNFTKDTAIRAGIALLYAHWEGGIKNIATFYLEYVSGLNLSYDQLKPNFLAVVLKNDFNKFKDSNKTSIHTDLVNRVLNSKTITTKMPFKGVIRTDSNLNSELFKEVMSTIGLPYDDYECSFVLIDKVLLCNRNRVAHGEHIEDIGIDETRYYEIHDKIFKLLEVFSNQIFDAANSRYYLK